MDRFTLIVRGAHLGFVIAATAIYALSLVLAGARLRAIGRALGASASICQTTGIVMAGIFANNITPLGHVGGELFRLTLLRNRVRLGLGRAMLTSALDRAVEVIPITLVVILALPSLAGFKIAWWIAGVGFLTLCVAILHALRSDWFARLWVARILRSTKVRLVTMVPGVSWATAIWIQDLTRLALITRAFDIKLSISQLAALAVVQVLGGLSPTPGGLGAVEGGLCATLHLFGVGTQTALAITLTERAISYGMATLLGGIATFTMGGTQLWKLSRSRSSATGICRESEESRSTSAISRDS